MCVYGRQILQFEYRPESNDYKKSLVDYVKSDVKSINIDDVDGDNQNEIIAGTSCWNAYDVRVLKYDNTTESYETVWKSQIGYTYASVGDLNGDGSKEILTVSGTHCGNFDSPHPNARIFRHSFGNYFKEIWKADEFKTGVMFGHGSNPAIGDLRSTENPEFALSMNINQTHYKVYIYEFSNNEFNQFQSINANPVSLFIGDSDNNKVNELLVCDMYDRNIKIYEAYEPIEPREESTKFAEPTTTSEEETFISMLNLTKSIEPHSIKKGQKTTVSITLENSGESNVEDIEIKDSIPSDFEYVEGKTSAKYDELKPQEYRVMQYVIKSQDSGEYRLPKASTSYLDENGDYKKLESNVATVKVIEPLGIDKPEKSTSNSNFKIRIPTNVILAAIV